MACPSRKSDFAINSTSVVRSLRGKLPDLEPSLYGKSACITVDVVSSIVRAVMLASSPSGSCLLPGTVGETIVAVAKNLGIDGKLIWDMERSGNIGILIGKRKAEYDLIVDAHIDKPGFSVMSQVQVRGKTTGSLFPCCANRFKIGLTRTRGKAVRFDASLGRVITVGSGWIVSDRSHTVESHLRFECEDGSLRAGDVVLHAEAPRRRGLRVSGSGLDNAAGVTVVLATSAVLCRAERDLDRAGFNCLIVLTDNEERAPEGFFGLGAARLAHAVPAPRCGVVVVDTHGVRGDIELGGGISCGFISALGRGATVPLNYQAATLELVEGLNLEERGTAQANHGYFSRSNDFAFMRWSSILGLLGVPTYRIHQGREESSLADMLGGIKFLSHFVPLILGFGEPAGSQSGARKSSRGA